VLAAIDLTKLYGSQVALDQWVRRRDWVGLRRLRHSPVVA
jgi:hypothetical protein